AGGRTGNGGPRSSPDDAPTARRPAVTPTANGYSTHARAPRAGHRLTGNQPRRLPSTRGRGEGHPMQLDQHPSSDESAESVVDLKTEPPTRTTHTSGTRSP